MSISLFFFLFFTLAFLLPQELVGTLRGFDDYVNMVLDDVTEYEIDADGTKRKVQLDQVTYLHA